MLVKKLLSIGIFTGLAAAIPIVYEANPEQFLRYADSWLSGPAPDPQPVAVLPAPRRLAKAEPEQLLGKKVRIETNDRGHFTAEFKFNGRRVDAMIDTGATFVAINLSTARKIGIKLTSDDFKYKVDTANGSTSGASTNIDELQIGRILVRDVPALVLYDEALSDPLIGMSFLQRLDKYSVENGSLLLVQ
ncbi:MAG TPA: TIGR02281 family clan AA aspartic protease [Rhizobiaceae bacterium]|nr:TIGR02281 family clan AA aspartic protease [Rhizobiaceae bacterium]